MEVKLRFARIYVAAVIMLLFFFPFYVLSGLVKGCRCTSNSLCLIVND